MNRIGGKSNTGEGGEDPMRYRAELRAGRSTIEDGDTLAKVKTIAPLTGRMLGNCPQAYSHVGLINCALSLSRQKGPAEERAASQVRPARADRAQ